MTIHIKTFNKDLIFYAEFLRQTSAFFIKICTYVNLFIFTKLIKGEFSRLFYSTNLFIFSATHYGVYAPNLQASLQRLVLCTVSTIKKAPRKVLLMFFKF